MTHEQFITIKTAQLAKQAGFDWGTTHYYHLYERCRTAKITDGKAVIDNNHQRTAQDFSAPTQAVLQRWLREEKGIIMSIFFAYKTIGSIITSAKGYSFDIVSSTHQMAHSNHYPTYEAALEAGLQKCLTLNLEKK